MGVCTIGLKVWSKDGYGRREYVQREMYNLKLKWAIGKMKWYRVDIKNSCSKLSTILSVIMGRDKYIYVLFFKCELGAVMKRSILFQMLRPRCLKDLFPYLVWAICQKYSPLVALRVAWECTWFTGVKKWLKLSGRFPEWNLCMILPNSRLWMSSS